MIKAAIYVRVSSADQREASLDDQEREARELCEEQGMEVVSVYRDYAKSGHDSRRPAYLEMIETAKAGKFSVIAAHHLDRLWRDPSEQESVVDTLDFAGVRVIDCRGIDSGEEGARMMMSILGMMARQESINTGRRVHRAHKGLAIRGLNVGGKTYGYVNPGCSEAKLTIDPEQARWVEWIFEKIAAGWSCRAIAADLNRQGVPSPGATWNRNVRRKDGKWLQSTVYALVRNRKYVGEFRWNMRRTKKQPRLNRRIAVKRDPKQWVTLTCEDLRIVGDELWCRAQAVIARRSIEVGAKVKAGIARARIESKARMSAISRGGAPKFLLSSILVCDECGSKLVTNGPNQAYHCSSRSQGGASACSNNVRVPRLRAEERILKNVREQMLSPEGVARYRKAVRDSAGKSMSDFSGREREWKAEKDRLESQMQNLLLAIKSGAGAIPALVEDMKSVQLELEALGPAPQAPTEARIALVEKMLDEYREVLTDLTTATGERITEARDALRELLGDIPVGRDPSGRPFAGMPPVYMDNGSGGRI